MTSNRRNQWFWKTSIAPNKFFRVIEEKLSASTTILKTQGLISRSKSLKGLNGYSTCIALMPIAFNELVENRLGDHIWSKIFA